ncbi:MAG: isoaspartyl peptidase/L-asparaginase [Bacteroidetes bacterium]|nr:isoaspartyl peptidase/L-asparaginase [Bacteroidota bacterium]
MQKSKRSNIPFNFQHSLINIRYSVLLLLCSFITACYSQNASVAPVSHSAKWVLVIHGGAGGKSSMTPEQQKQYEAKMREALKTGSEILEHQGSALDAVEAAIKVMEDSPLFNAGKGSVFTSEGKNEMDASIMDGKSLKAGAVASVTTIKNPISAARAVMEKSKHVLLVGTGAEIFAQTQGLKIVDPSYFYTKERWDDLQKAREQQKSTKGDTVKKHGTVGAVALDMYGNLAAGTSTGGMTNKMKGRVGDSPIIGAGTYANNNTCAVSCTGHGEYFIRNVVAYDISALMEYKGISLEEATSFEIREKLRNQGASGGLIAVDKNGNIAMPFNSEMMFRGFINSDGKTEISH